MGSSNECRRPACWRWTVTDPRFFVYEHMRKDSGEVFYVGKGTWTPKKRYIRASTTSKRNVHWKRVVAKCGGFDHRIVAEFDSEDGALREEVRRIGEYGRSNFGGVLVNITSGGEGQSGVVMSSETKQKIADANRGKPKPDHVKRAVSAAQRGVSNPPEQSAKHSLRMRGEKNPNYNKKNSAETIAKRVATRGSKCSGESHPFFGKSRPAHVVQRLREANSLKVVDMATGETYQSVKCAASAFGRSESTVSRWLHGVRRNPTSLRFA